MEHENYGTKVCVFTSACKSASRIFFGKSKSSSYYHFKRCLVLIIPDI